MWKHKFEIDVLYSRAFRKQFGIPNSSKRPSFVVLLFKNFTDLRKFHKGISHQTYACYQKLTLNRRAKEVGVISLVYDKNGGGSYDTVVHECTHAAFHLLLIEDVRFSDAEEFVSQVTGELSGGLLTKLVDLDKRPYDKKGKVK